eukprot:tig00020960_g16563.t1
MGARASSIYRYASSSGPQNAYALPPTQTPPALLELPVEIWEVIMSFLSFDDFVALAAVSSSFRFIVLREPDAAPRDGEPQLPSAAPPIGARLPPASQGELEGRARRVYERVRAARLRIDGGSFSERPLDADSEFDDRNKPTRVRQSVDAFAVSRGGRFVAMRVQETAGRHRPGPQYALLVDFAEEPAAVHRREVKLTRGADLLALGVPGTAVGGSIHGAFERGALAEDASALCAVRSDFEGLAWFELRPLLTGEPGDEEPPSPSGPTSSASLVPPPRSSSSGLASPGSPGTPPGRNRPPSCVRATFFCFAGPVPIVCLQILPPPLDTAVPHRRVLAGTADGAVLLVDLDHDKPLLLRLSLSLNAAMRRFERFPRPHELAASRDHGTVAALIAVDALNPARPSWHVRALWRRQCALVTAHVSCEPGRRPRLEVSEDGVAVVVTTEPEGGGGVRRAALYPDGSWRPLAAPPGGAAAPVLHDRPGGGPASFVPGRPRSSAPPRPPSSTSSPRPRPRRGPRPGRAGGGARAGAGGGGGAGAGRGAQGEEGAAGEPFELLLFRRPALAEGWAPAAAPPAPTSSASSPPAARGPASPPRSRASRAGNAIMSFLTGSADADGEERAECMGGAGGPGPSPSSSGSLVPVVNGLPGTSGNAGGRRLSAKERKLLFRALDAYPLEAELPRRTKRALDQSRPKACTFETARELLGSFEGGALYQTLFALAMSVDQAARNSESLGRLATDAPRLPRRALGLTEPLPRRAQLADSAEYNGDVARTAAAMGLPRGVTPHLLGLLGRAVWDYPNVMLVQGGPPLETLPYVGLLCKAGKGDLADVRNRCRSADWVLRPKKSSW